MSGFRKSFPTNIKQTTLAGAWTKILDLMDVPREGFLRSDAAFKIDIAFSGTPAATEITTISEEPTEFLLPSYKELWARVEDAGLGPGALYGTLWYE